MTLARPISYICAKTLNLDSEDPFYKQFEIFRVLPLFVFAIYGSFWAAFSIHRSQTFSNAHSKFLIRVQKKCDSLFDFELNSGGFQEYPRTNAADQKIIPFIRSHPARSAWFVIFGPLGIFPFLFWFIYDLDGKSSSPKNLKHSMKFLAPGMGDDRKLTEEDGILVGKSDRTILPKFSQQFAEKKEMPIILPYDRLSRGVTILGGQGSGKTRLMFALHDGIREKYPEIPILIHDPKAEWLRVYYNPETDIIFAPYDTRRHAWSLWDDFTNSPSLRHSIITAAVYAYHSNQEDLWSRSSIDLIHSLSFRNSLADAKAALRQKIREHYEQPFISTYENSKPAFMDIARIELDAQAKSGNGHVMSLDQFLNWKGRIFLLNSPDCAEKQKGTFNLFLSAFLQKALSMKDVGPGSLRAAAFVDEALSFHLPEQMQNRFFTMSRSKGLCIVAGAQRLPDKQIGERGSWGDTPAYTFMMRLDNLPTQELLSKSLGDMTYEQTKKSKTRGESSSTTTSDIREQHRIVPAEHFSNLAPQSFILKHESGFVSGRTVNVDRSQRDEIPEFQFQERRDVIEFMQDL